MALRKCQAILLLTTWSLILQSCKICIFPKMVSHGFGEKLKTFLPWIISGELLKIVFGEILDRKVALRDYKNINITKLHNLHISKELNTWFCAKLGISWPWLFSFEVDQKELSGDILDRKILFLSTEILILEN